MDKTTVVNIYSEDCDIYIGRDSSPYHYGNPFPIGIGCTREEAILKFDLWLSGVAHTHVEPERRKWIIKNMKNLKGKRIGCSCAPKPCHGDVYVKILDRERSNG